MAAQPCRPGRSSGDFARIEGERNEAMKEKNGVAVGQCKGMYQLDNGGVVLRNYFPTNYNVFGVKEEDCKQFVVDILREIQMRQKKLLKKEVYLSPAINIIGKTKLPEVMSNKGLTSYRKVEFEPIASNGANHSNQIKLVNTREGVEQNGVYCFLKELLIFARFINLKYPIVDDMLFQTTTIRNDMTDEELF